VHTTADSLKEADELLKDFSLASFKQETQIRSNDTEALKLSMEKLS